MAKSGRVYSAYDRKNQARPEEVRKRVARNKARRAAAKKYGKAAIKGKDVHHVGGMKNGKKPGRTKLMSRSKNRGMK